MKSATLNITRKRLKFQIFLAIAQRKKKLCLLINKVTNIYVNSFRIYKYIWASNIGVNLAFL